MKLVAYASALAALVLVGSVIPTAASSTTAATLKCPSCGMPMPTHKTAVMTVPIYIKSKHTVYYCCPQCPSGKAAAAYWTKHHKPMPV
jgi:hypothetical protein